MDIKKLATDLGLQGQIAQHGLTFNVEAIAGAEVLRIEVEDRAELPIFLSVSEEQVLCIAYLFKQGEIKPAKVAEMNDAMLSTNISMPLSSFAKIGEQYVIYGALSTAANVSEIVHEIETLSSNSIEAIKAMKDYLV